MSEDDVRGLCSERAGIDGGGLAWGVERMSEERGRTGRYVLGFDELDQTQIAAVGGKGAHLGELSRIEGLRVPAGFCVTAEAFQRIIAKAPSIDDQLERLSSVHTDDGEAIRAVSTEIRQTIERMAMFLVLTSAITWYRLN